MESKGTMKQNNSEPAKRPERPKPTAHKQTLKTLK